MNNTTMKIIDRNFINNTKLNFNNPYDCIAKISDGNQGASVAVMNVLVSKDEKSLQNLFGLGIKGVFLFCLWKQCCNGDPQKFEDALSMIYNDPSLDPYIEANLSKTQAYPIFEPKTERPNVDRSHPEFKKYLKKESDIFKSTYGEEFGIKNFGE